ncbi:MAG: hypothetical protein IJJ10_04210 [Bacillus sp. (in: Bacteria)]|uniref:hypothetical protein n=1 Tax=Bacillus cereus TaxID=1396 RepID=UPI000BEE59B1|nr:hypothetical protein [Bacillus cereus]MBQ6446655.1 hypothetical protein [Bacillus sp. (in: firmicutes)]MBR3120560.1 hypothetical protein [Oceanobacillus sp.]PDY19544.1 hypothetical protein COM76_09360 [Bacillus cereus]
MSGDENLKKVKKLFVNNGEYKFNDAHDAERFAKQLLWKIEALYAEESFHREYESLSDFIGSHHADSEAYWLYTDGDY